MKDRHPGDAGEPNKKECIEYFEKFNNDHITKLTIDRGPASNLESPPMVVDSLG